MAHVIEAGRNGGTTAAANGVGTQLRAATIGLLMFSGIAATFPPAALAGASVDGDMLGRLQSGLDFCTQRNPRAAMWYRDQAKQLLQSATAQDVAAARQTQEYRAAYEENRAALDAQSKDDSAAACNSRWQAGYSEPVASPDAGAPQADAGSN